MQMKIHLASMAMAALLLLILGSGCASSPAAPPSSPAQPPSSQGQPSGTFVKQVPITSYMRSQEGTPNELSPLAPPEAKNIRKVGHHWVCEINGRALVFNRATSCWEPQQK
jgi:hypothetical protein